MEQPKDFPTELKVLGKTWALKYIEAKAGDPEPSGECLIGVQTITIDKRNHHEYNQDTMLHELLHAISDTLGLKLTEAKIHALAPGILAVMKDNPPICEFIFGVPQRAAPLGWCVAAADGEDAAAARRSLKAKAKSLRWSTDEMETAQQGFAAYGDGTVK